MQTTSGITRLFAALPAIRWKRLIVVSLLFWLAITIFSLIVEEVFEQDTMHFDAGLLLWLNSHATPVLDHFMIRITELGGGVAGISILLLLGGYLWICRYRRAAIFAVTAIAGAGLLNSGLKLLFGRERPDLWQSLIAETTYSFPSGHAMLSSTVAMTVVVLLWHSRWRWWAIVGGGLYAFVIGVSRLYLGVHYPTDIVAGWCVSVAWLVIVTGVIFHGGFVRTLRPPRITREEA